MQLLGYGSLSCVRVQGASHGLVDAGTDIENEYFPNRLPIVVYSGRDLTVSWQEESKVLPYPRLG
jgi:hypothetical protein